MKPLQVFFASIAVCAVIVMLTGFTTPLPHGVVTIQPYLKLSDPRMSTAQHRDWDVVVYEDSMSSKQWRSPGFGVIYYRMEHNELQYHLGFYGTKNHYASASYQWENDSTIIGNIYGGDAKDSLEFHLYGKGSVSGMIVPDSVEKKWREMEKTNGASGK